MQFNQLNGGDILSRQSIKFTIEEQRFNLKTIALVMGLIDLFILPYLIPDLWEVFWWLIVYEVSVLISFMMGLKGQGRFKEVMLNLRSLASNKSLTSEEHEAQLVQGIHHHCLELGYLYDQRNKTYGLHLFKRNGNGKTTKIKQKILEPKNKRIVIKK